MNNKDTSAPAFPVTDGSNFNGAYGLSKRELFAAMAMQGDWAAQSGEAGFFGAATSEEQLQRSAMSYVRMADALLAELEKQS